MSSRSDDQKLARAVQKAVVARRGGSPPAYQHCLNEVRKLLAVPREQRPPEQTRQAFHAQVVETVVARTT